MVASNAIKSKRYQVDYKNIFFFHFNIILVNKKPPTNLYLSRVKLNLPHHVVASDPVGYYVLHATWFWWVTDD